MLRRTNKRVHKRKDSVEVFADSTNRAKVADEKELQHKPTDFLVMIANGSHLIPFRTQK